MQTFLATGSLVIILLLIAALVALAVRRLRIPYTVALVLVGLVLTLWQPLHVELTPELFLVVFLPPLVFEAAFHINLSALRRDWLPIALLAVPGVVLTMLIAGGMIWLGAEVVFPMALVFGALISATDPVSVVALFRRLGVPRRLGILVESESLLNDGTAIVLFNLMVAFAAASHFDGLSAVGDFIRVSAGGVLVGLGLGWMVSQLISRVDDYLIETTLTTVLAYGAYLAADQLGVSGVLAVVTAGLINGNIGARGMSPTTRIVVFNFWEYAAFLANSMVFLLIGLQVNLHSLLAAWEPILWAILGVLAARIVVVYGLGMLSNLFRRPGDAVPVKWLHVVNWGGLRGGMALALALSLPASLGNDRTLLQAMAFGVVLFSLLVEGTTMGTLISRLKLVERSEGQVAFEIQRARLTSLRSAVQHLERLHREGLVPGAVWEAVKTTMAERTAAIAADLHEAVRTMPDIQAQILENAQREFLSAQRSALQGMLRSGAVSDDAYEEISAEVDYYLGQPPEELFNLPEAPSNAEEPNTPAEMTQPAKTRPHDPA